VEEKHLARLLSIAVVPRFRRCGIGKKLLAALIESTKKEGSRGMKLEVNESNARALNLYQSFGFQVQEKISNYYPDGRAAVVMVLKW